MNSFGLLHGCNEYPDINMALAGCLYDLSDVYSLISVDTGKVPSANVRILANESMTKDNMLASWEQMVGIVSKLASAGERTSLFYWYSGHGAQVADTAGTEVDGKTEIFVPYDINSHWNDPLTDALFMRFVYSIPQSCRALLGIDACHSEGIYTNSRGLVPAFVTDPTLKLRSVRVPDAYMPKESTEKSRSMAIPGVPFVDDRLPCVVVTGCLNEGVSFESSERENEALGIDRFHQRGQFTLFFSRMARLSGERPSESILDTWRRAQDEVFKLGLGQLPSMSAPERLLSKPFRWFVDLSVD